MSLTVHVSYCCGMSEIIDGLRQISTEGGLIRFDFEAGGSTWVPACNVFCISNILPDGEGEE